ncbi:pilus assembly protein TadG-related protein [Aquidulcibacter sp.]|uniref:pilus assembly protein TadG-related protein n=1 Tax=Aquidulcibacter sp. TaxID=2052990 RepID=UPI0025C65346|nr:pilus assembly protein TadG-related protein [Aquidulcibacter sp.]
MSSRTLIKGQSGLTHHSWISHKSQRGQLAVITGLAAMPLAMIVAITVEMAALTAERGRMQSAVDAAALAGARQASLSVASASVTNYAVSFASQQVVDLAPRMRISFTATQSVNNTVQVNGTANRDSFFGNLVPPGGFTIRVSATADALNQQPLCVLGLRDRNKQSSIWVSGSGQIQASNCLVHANGTIRSTELGRVTAGAISARVRAFGTGFSPSVNTGAMIIQNPFQGRQIIAKSECQKEQGEDEVTYAGTSNVTLPAGVHTQRVSVADQAKLTLGRGDHFFCDGLEIKDEGSLRGEDVALLFERGSLIAEDEAMLDLTGRTTGAWAGFLIAADFSNQSDMVISSPNVNKLLGAIYLSNANLNIDTAGMVAEDSRWSVVIAQNVNLSGNSRLVINSNYAGSGVPVPVGAGNNTGPQQSGARLRQ